MRRDAWAAWVLAVLFLALPAMAEEPMPLVDVEGTGDRTALEGLARRSPEEWFGWEGDRVVVSRDQGHSWSKVGHFPEKPIRALVFPKDGRVFAETGAGKLLISSDSGRSWTLSKGWLEPYDFAVAAGRKLGETGASGASAASPEFPLDCLLTAPAAVVKVRSGIQGGDGASQRVLDLELSQDKASLSGEREAGEKPVKVSRKLSRDEGLRLTRALLDAARRQEAPLGCGSATKYKAVIEWSCNPEQSWRRKAELQADACGPRTGTDSVGASQPAGAAAEGYARALGIHQVASQALTDASR